MAAAASIHVCAYDPTLVSVAGDEWRVREEGMGWWRAAGGGAPRRAPTGGVATVVAVP